jgi:hypothetical protein
VSTLLKGRHFVIQHYRASGYVRIARTAAAFASPEDAAESWKDCDVAVSALDVSRLALLFDWRLAPLSTDARLHRFLVRRSDVYAKQFARCALLVDTPLGKLQSLRVGRAHSTAAPIVVLDNEAAAIRYLIGR